MEPGCTLTHLIDLLAVEVGETNVLYQSLVHQLLHGNPRVQKVGVVIDHGAVCILGHLDITRLEGYWPVHQIEVEVLQLEGGQ